MGSICRAIEAAIVAPVCWTLHPRQPQEAHSNNRLDVSFLRSCSSGDRERERKRRAEPHEPHAIKRDAGLTAASKCARADSAFGGSSETGSWLTPVPSVRSMTRGSISDTALM